MQSRETSADIASVEAARTMGIIPNDLLVQLTDGSRERLVVRARGEWVEAVRAHLAKPREYR